MILSTTLLTVVLAALTKIQGVVGQLDAQGPILYNSEHNATDIYGTWTSASKKVLTGAGFANPANMTFTYPTNTGVSYSFSSDGFYEISRYRFNGNGSEPSCITGVIGWVHGSYSLNANGSITMVPMGDGFQQIQDPCAAQSNFVEVYNNTEYYIGWRIFQDPTAGYKLHLFMFDGTPVAPLFQVSTTPNMLPTKLLRNVTTADDASLQRRDVSAAYGKVVVYNPRWVTAVLGAVALALVATTSSVLL